jgi:hypothetical protein
VVRRSRNCTGAVCEWDPHPPVVNPGGGFAYVDGGFFGGNSLCIIVRSNVLRACIILHQRTAAVVNAAP